MAQGDLGILPGRILNLPWTDLRRPTVKSRGVTEKSAQKGRYVRNYGHIRSLRGLDWPFCLPERGFGHREALARQVLLEAALAIMV